MSELQNTEKLTNDEVTECMEFLKEKKDLRYVVKGNRQEERVIKLRIYKNTLLN